MQTIIKLGLSKKKDLTPVLLKSVKLLTERQVLVGVPDVKADREDKGINNAALAYIHDQGSPAQNIPARPFLGPGIKDAKLEIQRRLEQVAKIALRGAIRQDIERGLSAVGMTAQSAVRNRITKGPFAVLKPATLAARRRRGRRGTKPLIDTGQLRNSITYVVRKAAK